MSRFDGSFQTTETLPVPLEQAIAHFSDPETIVACSADVEEARIEGDTIHFVLTEQDHGITKFQGRYACRYQREGDRVVWGPVGEGNTEQSGEARFEAIDDATTRVEYSEQLALELDVPSMVAPMLQPVIGAVVGKELAGFFGRMRDRLGA